MFRPYVEKTSGYKLVGECFIVLPHQENDVGIGKESDFSGTQKTSSHDDGNSI